MNISKIYIAELSYATYAQQHMHKYMLHNCVVQQTIIYECGLYIVQQIYVAQCISRISLK